jgi:hypothetical protein
MYARGKDFPFPLILLIFLQLVVLSWFRPSSPTFCSSSIQLDVSYTQPLAYDKHVVSVYKRSSRVSPGIWGGWEEGGGELGMGEIYELCGNRCAHSGAHETHERRCANREHSRFFYSLVIKQFNITNTGLDNATWCETPRIAAFTDRSDLYRPDPLARRLSSRKTLWFKDIFFLHDAIYARIIYIYYLASFFIILIV